MQVVRLVKGGYVDRIITFDSLPERFFSNVEKVDVRLYKLPRYWEKYAPFHYVLEYEMINKDKEAWQAITNFLRQAVDKSTVTLMDKIEEMALPMASNSKEALGIEPEDIPVIPIPEELREKNPVIPVVAPSAPIEMIKCPECAKEFSSKQAVKMHKMRKHAKEAVPA